MPPSFSQFASNLTVETAFNVLARAKQLKAAGKEVVELEIGDSPFPSTSHAKRIGQLAIEADHTHYCPSDGLPEFRHAIAQYMRSRYGLDIGAEHVVVGPGAKVFELFFCQLFLDPGDGVLVFSPHFPTYVPNILSRQARIRFSVLRQERQFRPDPADVERFLVEDPRPKAIFINSPHNPTGGVATWDDLLQIAELVRRRNVAVFSDEPYDRMVWSGEHRSLIQVPGLLDHTVAVYTFSKSFSMSGWRVGYAICSPVIARMIGQLINTTLSCTPPFVQLAAKAALEGDETESLEMMATFRRKVELLAEGLSRIEGVKCFVPAGTFYVFPNVAAICNRLGITSHGLAMYLLEAADDRFGVACLGGECFGEAGAGFLRFSCAEKDERIARAVAFLPDAFSRKERVKKFLEENPSFKLASLYPE
ncbi:MAG: aminotransferase class I/II-fold pyridoxal phosphate-dependent enzyme [Thermoguttaceae bacterium]|nr:aminotransferase class I/II-fold pyridoxal phosphate-dependent enzyme [Thermoguttaceae bacterium]MDW8078533.1 aminotransferase class I/II-fold pyridoxal phosphate-dependent enzyme [Thermoguttaceae bacterium]